MAAHEIWKAMNLSREDVTPEEKFVLIMLADVVGTDGTLSINQRRLCDRTGYDAATIQRVLRQLDDKGFIVRSVSADHHSLDLEA